MARFPERHLNQTAVYWESPTNDGRGGYTYDDPAEIDCRWVGKMEVITGMKGDEPGIEVISTAQVLVKQDVDENGVLYLGELTDLTSGQRSNPKLIDTAFKIKRFEKIPTIKSGRFLRKVYL